jgi:hypothetical protein
MLVTNSQSLSQNEDKMSDKAKAKDQKEGTRPLFEAKTTGKKRTRSSSGLDDSAAFQVGTAKRFCFTEMGQAYSDLSDSFRVNAVSQHQPQGEPDCQQPPKGPTFGAKLEPARMSGESKTHVRARGYPELSAEQQMYINAQYQQAERPSSQQDTSSESIPIYKSN